MTERGAVERLQVRIAGLVQGVGFRPFVARLAQDLGLCGWVRNDDQGLTLEVEGFHEALIEFLDRLHRQKPPPSYLYAVEHRFLTPANYSSFQILESKSEGPAETWVLPDLATCRECRNEIFDRANRRFRYPFTNCTHCGPRFSIIRNMPYDRKRTSMHSFGMCDNCEKEYHAPDDRRFHAQPNACPVCGPQLEYIENGVHVTGEEALGKAAQKIRDGGIVTFKGIGGYQLIADARSETAIAELRRRKKRERKAFAVMYPDLQSLRRHVDTPRFAQTLLRSTQAPILLLPRLAAAESEIAPSVAPESPYLGVFLPYTPMHHLLLNDLGFPVVATSGNFSDEPIQFQDEQARAAMYSLCDAFLRHNRQIEHHADDSVMQLVTKPEMKTQMLRRARGYAPLPLLCNRDLPPILALGGHMNATFAFSRKKEVILSQHLGDMEGYESRIVYRNTLRDFLRLYKVEPAIIVHDLHPDYFTTELANEFQLPKIAVQHHHAHLAACLLENQIEGEVLGFTWDGTGYGLDQTVWGGEFLQGNAEHFRRVGSLYPFRLAGGEKGIKETWRTALSLLYESFGPDIPLDLPLLQAVPKERIDMTLQVLLRPALSPVTTSIGRLFDGISAILGISYFNTHQAESAQQLEYAAWKGGGKEFELPFPIIEGEPLRLDWRELVRSLVSAFHTGISAKKLAASFHHALVEAAVAVATRIGEPKVILAGGVFCNRYLTERLLVRLKQENIHGYIHSQLPPTDGSLSAGQLWVAANQR